MNDAGEVVGYYYDANHNLQGFVYESGIYVGLSDPQGEGTYVTAINNSGQIVGYYETDSFSGFAVASPATLTLTDGAMLSGDTLAINPASLLAIEQPNAQGDGATFDDVQVDNSGTIQIDPGVGVTLTISDGSTVTGGLLSIGPVGVLDVEGGSFSQEVLLDGVSINNNDIIHIGVSSIATLTLDDGTTIEGGALTVNGGSTLDVEYGSNGPGATLDNVGISGAGTILVDSEGNSGTDLLLRGNTTITSTALTIDSPGMVEIAPDVVGGNYVSPTFTNLSLDNAGTVQLDPNTILLIGGYVALTGGGTVELMTATEQFAAAIAGAGSGVLDNFNNTIEANGDGASIGIDDQSLTFINESGGTVDADGNDSSNENGDVSIALDTGNTVTNDGILEATNGGMIFVYDPLTGSGTDVIENGGAFVLAAANGQTVAFEGSGGTLTTNGAIDGGSATGISATSTSGAAMTITINTSSTVTSTGADAIDATDSGGAGDISITADGAVTGAVNGIDAIQSGGGNLIIGGSANVIGQAGDGISAEQSATGLGDVLINSFGNVTGTGPGSIGILAEILNAADGDNVTVEQVGNVSGGQVGIEASTAGNGNVSVTSGSDDSVSGTKSFTVGTTAYTGTALYGIQAKSLGAGSINVTTGTADLVSSAGTGIWAVNQATAIPQSGGVTVSSITVNAYGTIDSGSTPDSTGAQPAGIVAAYRGGNTGTPNANVFGNVTVNDYANISAAEYGLRAGVWGNGNVIVNDGASGFATTVAALYGIYAFSEVAGNINIATSTGDVITGGNGVGIGIQAVEATGNATISIASGATVSGGTGILLTGLPGSATFQVNNDGTITGSSGPAIASNLLNGDTVIIDNLGTINGPIALTFPAGTVTADDSVTLSTVPSATVSSASGADITININNPLTSSSADGLDVTDLGGAGVITITADSAVTGALNGIVATQNGTGDIDIGGAGFITGQSGDGITAEQSTTGLGGLLIDGTGDVTGAGFSSIGILAEIINGADSANMTIDQTGNISGGQTAIEAVMDGSGNVSVTTGSGATITGTALYGIYDINQYRQHVSDHRRRYQHHLRKRRIYVINQAAAIPQSDEPNHRNSSWNHQFGRDQ